MKLKRQALEFLSQNGYFLVKKAIDTSLCMRAIDEAERIKNISGFNEKKMSQNKQRRNHFNSNYVVENNRVSYFFENINSSDPSINLESLIKIGHNLHMNNIFKDINSSKVISEYERILQMEPLIIQSMILEKLPIKGGTVTMHQDSTYLLSEPDSIFGWWIPLEDANQENGCIWVLPGSHKNKLYYRYKMVDGMPNYEIDGPIDYNEKNCIPIEMQRGDLLILNGKILHKSHENNSKKSRFAYTWHTMDKRSKWAQQNWRSFEEIKKTQIHNI